MEIDKEFNRRLSLVFAQISDTVFGSYGSIVEKECYSIVEYYFAMHHCIIFNR